MKLLEGKVALITGGTRGIGKGIVEVFAAQGAKVAFTYAGSVEKAQELEKSLSSVTQIKGYQSDASDHEAAQKLVDDVILYESPHKINTTLEQIKEFFGENTKVSLSREISKKFEETKRGTIDELIAFSKSKTLKGEIVLIVNNAI